MLGEKPSGCSFWFIMAKGIAKALKIKRNWDVFMK